MNNQTYTFWTTFSQDSEFEVYTTIPLEFNISFPNRESNAENSKIIDGIRKRERTIIDTYSFGFLKNLRNFRDFYAFTIPHNNERVLREKKLQYVPPQLVIILGHSAQDNKNKNLVKLLKELPEREILEKTVFNKNNNYTKSQFERDLQTIQKYLLHDEIKTEKLLYPKSQQYSLSSTNGKFRKNVLDTIFGAPIRNFDKNIKK